MALPNTLKRDHQLRTRGARSQKPQGQSTASGSESDLVRRYYTDGDRTARDQLIERLMPLAHQLASRYQQSNVAFDDLVQVASIGLVKAVDRFDPSRGNALSSYAVPTILGELKRYFRDTGWSLHVPRDLQERVMHVNHTSDALSRKLGRTPTPSEIATETRDSTENVLEAMEAASAYDSVSLESSFDGDEDEGESYVNLIGSEDEHFTLVEDAASVAPELQGLSRRERLVLGLRFVEDLTQSQIAARIGVSQMHVSRLIRRALERVRVQHNRGVEAAFTESTG